MRKKDQSKRIKAYASAIGRLLAAMPPSQAASLRSYALGRIVGPINGDSAPNASGEANALTRGDDYPSRVTALCLSRRNHLCHLGSFPRPDLSPNGPNYLGCSTHPGEPTTCPLTSDPFATRGGGGSPLPLDGNYDKSPLMTTNNQLSSNEIVKDEGLIQADKLCEPTKVGDKVGEPVSEWEVEERVVDEDERVVGVEAGGCESQEEEVIEIKVVGECMNSMVMVGEKEGGGRVSVRKPKWGKLRLGARYKCRWSGVGELWELVV